MLVIIGLSIKVVRILGLCLKSVEFSVERDY